MTVIAALPLIAACAAPEPTPVPTPTPIPTPTPAPAPAEEEVIELVWSNVYPLMHPGFYDVEQLLIERVEEFTNGRVKYIYFHGGSMLSYFENWDGVKAGLVDQTDMWLHFYPGQFRITEVFHLPFLATSSIVASAAANDFAKRDPEIQKEFGSVKVLTVHSSAITDLHTRTELVKSMEDLKGMIIGCESADLAKMVDNWGGTPMQVDVPQGVLALDKGVIDGGLWPWAPLRSFGLADYLNYHTVIGLSFVVCMQSFNKERWESLPDDVRSVIDEVMGGDDWTALIGYTLDNGSRTDQQWMKEKGDQFYTMPPDEARRWFAGAEFTVDEWLEEMKARGVDGEKIWQGVQDSMKQYADNPLQMKDWYGYAGEYGSPRRPGGWD